jgi:hypothetical protein
MRNFTFLPVALLLGISTQAQTVATFDTLTLPKADTFYVNYSQYGDDMGFDDGLAHFPCVYDTFPGGWQYWKSGFSYSNMTDSLTAGYTNQYSSITGSGYNGSPQYIIGWDVMNKIYLKGKAKGQPVNGFYLANTAYTYYSMRDGDMFAKKFGGVSGNDSDYLLITVRGYLNGQLKTDSVQEYLADFTSADNTKDTIYRGWRWINLLPLGNVDSLQIELASSDVSPFGMNTPGYYAIDNFTTNETASVNTSPSTFAAKVYPNPAVGQLFIELKDHQVTNLEITDVTGRVVAGYEAKEGLTSLPVSSLPAGVYILNMWGGTQKASVRFVKQ